MALIAPSLLAADWSQLGQEVQSVEQAGADWIHLDVMDGSFVPPITFGAQVVDTIKKSCGLVIDVHLMISNPELHLKAFADAGADVITVHREACPHLHRTLQSIRELGIKSGVAINPGTAVSSLESVVDCIDLLLVMTVNPGWGGQSYIPSSSERIAEARSMLGARKVHIQVDGGIDAKTIQLASQSGADVFVAGTSVFRAEDYRTAITALRTAATAVAA